jgi:hypothetical protein
MRLAAIALVLAGVDLAGLLSVGANAQVVPSPFPADQAILFRPDVAGTREIDGTRAEGFGVGGFSLFPQLRLTGAYDSNIFNLANTRREDVALAIEPRLALRSNWGRHSLSVSGDARLLRFADITTENSDAWRANIDGRLDVTDATQLFVGGELARAVELRGAGGLNVPDSFPITYRQTRGNFGLTSEIGGIDLALAGGLVERRYDDVVPFTGPAIDQSLRDVRILSVTPRLGYKISPGIALFGSGTYTDTRSLEELGLLTRDATGLVLVGGVRGELSPVVVGEVSAGWLKRDFAGSLGADYSGVTFGATLDWYATPLLSLRLSTRQDFDNSGIATVPGILSRETGLRAFFEARRNLLVSAEVTLVNDRYREIDVTTDTVNATARGEYRFNPNLSAAMVLRWRHRSTSDAETVNGYSGMLLGFAIETRF